MKGIYRLDHHYHDHHSHYHEKFDPFMNLSITSDNLCQYVALYVFDLVYSDVWQQPGPHRIWKHLNWQYSSCFVCRRVPKGRGVVTRSIRRIIFLVCHRSKVLLHSKTNSSSQMLYLYLCLFVIVSYSLLACILMVKELKSGDVHTIQQQQQHFT